MPLPNEADRHAGIVVCAAECVYNKQALVGQLFLCDRLAGVPCLFRSRMIVIFVFVGGPPYGIFGVVVHYDEFVFRGASRINAGHHVYRAQLADLSLFVPLQLRSGLFIEQHLVRRIVHDLGRAGNAILA